MVIGVGGGIATASADATTIECWPLGPGDYIPILASTQIFASVFTDQNGVWTGRYGGEDWSVTAESKEAVMALLVEKMEQAMNNPEWNARINELAPRSIAGESAEEGFEAEYTGEKSYDDRMIELMETRFSQD